MSMEGFTMDAPINGSFTDGSGAFDWGVVWDGATGLLDQGLDYLKWDQEWDMKKWIAEQQFVSGNEPTGGAVGGPVTIGGGVDAMPQWVWLALAGGLAVAAIVALRK